MKMIDFFQMLIFHKKAIEAIGTKKWLFKFFVPRHGTDALFDQCFSTPFPVSIFCKGQRVCMQFLRVGSVHLKMA